MLITKILNNKTMKNAYFSWLFVSLFFAYQYILRVTPGVMFDQIVIAFNITAEEFATLGALYLLAYSLMQIPLGIIVDRVGVKKTILVSILLCIIGTFCFAFSSMFLIAQISRLLMGIGSAAGFICAVKLVSDHFAPGQRGMLMGITLAMGAIGAIIAGVFINTTIVNFSGRYVLIFSGIVGIVLFLLIAITLKDDSKVKDDSKGRGVQLNTTPLRNIHKSIWKIMTSRPVLKYSIMSIALYTPLSVLADLWGTAFLQQKYSLSQADAAFITLSLYLGMAVGSFVISWLSEKYNIMDQCMVVSAIIIAVLFANILYADIYHKNILSIVFIMLGFFCGCEMCCFNRALTFISKKNSGEVIGCINTFNMIGSAILHQVIGYNMDLNWKGNIAANGTRIYSTEDFVNALSVLLVVIILCLIMFFFIKLKKQARV